MSNEIDDMDALFDSIAAQTASASSATAAKPVDADGPTSIAPAAEPDNHAVIAGVANEGDDMGIYDRLGTIVRTLHNSMRELGYDKALSDSAENINAAQDRLAYIATLTEDAANKVLNLLDIAMPAQGAVVDTAKAMNLRWKSMMNGELSVEEFKQLAHDSVSFTETVANEAEIEKSRLLEIMMAQDFQDLTGQMIKKIITITKNVEKSLASLLLDSAPPDMKEKVVAHNAIRQEQPVDLLAGPDIPTNAMAQDDVDSMLADLGF